MHKEITFWQAITYIVYIIVIVFAITAIFSNFNIGGIKLLTIQSGSMEPAIKTGSMVFVKKVANYNVGDIITRQPAGQKETITHRIVDSEFANDGSTEYTTQGDANNSPDSDKVSSSSIVGKVLFAIPYLGFAVSFSRTLPGLIILIIVPAIIIIFDEFNNIKKEIVLWQKERRGQHIQTY